mgnify:CR=1 FL=1
MWDIPSKREEVLVCTRAMFLALQSSWPPSTIYPFFLLEVRHSASSAPPRTSIQGGWFVVDRSVLLDESKEETRCCCVGLREESWLSHREDVRVRGEGGVRRKRGDDPSKGP